MATYYNEWDKNAAAWLRELIRQGHLPGGDVDERSITDVQPSDLAGYTQCHFFAGIGGWSYALRLAGWEDERSVWTGSCPCQPFSAAGKRTGTKDTRHLWPEFYRLIAECRPTIAFGEQVASRLGREWLSGVRVDLEALGYAVGAADLCAASVGAPHIRQRLFWVGDAEKPVCQQRDIFSYESNLQPWSSGRSGSWRCADGFLRRIEPGTLPLAHGVPARMGRLRGYGNAIVPQVAAAFVRAYLDVR